jgi:hypothetical protein
VEQVVHQLTELQLVLVFSNQVVVMGDLVLVVAEWVEL